MKHIRIIILLVVVAFIASCTTTQKFSVVGKPGTEIYTPSHTKVGTIDNTGVAQIELESDAYYAFLLSKDNASDRMIPFALDYKEFSYTGSSFTKWFGMILTFAGAGAALISCIMLIVSPELGGLMFAASVGFTGAIMPMGMAGSGRQRQLDHVYKFKYLPTQTTNQDFSFTHPDIKSVEFMPYQKEDASAQVVDATPIESTEKASSKSTKSFSSKSTKSFKDYGALLEGVYVGTGTLSINGKTIESYKDIKIDLHRIDKNEVAVQVVEANGVEFFGEASAYSIKNNGDGTYSLVHESISVATIDVDVDKQMFYFHPRVNIDGDMYTLKITANKK